MSLNTIKIKSKQELELENIKIFHSIKHKAAVAASLIIWLLAGSLAFLINSNFVASAIACAAPFSIPATILFVTSILTITFSAHFLFYFVWDCFLDSRQNYNALSWLITGPVLLLAMLAAATEGIWCDFKVIDRDKIATLSSLCKELSSKYKKNANLLEQQAAAVDESVSQKGASNPGVTDKYITTPLLSPQSDSNQQPTTTSSKGVVRHLVSFLPSYSVHSAGQSLGAVDASSTTPHAKLN